MTANTNMNDPHNWPRCIHPGCENVVNPKRVQIIGKALCLEHGELPRQFTVAPAFNKGGYQLITRREVSSIGKK